MRLEILLVDDEPTLRLALSDALRRAGHQVETAADGKKALQLVRARVYDVVVCDLLLPGAHGSTVFKYLREHSPATDVILITGHGSVKDAVEALKEGATDYLTKPFEVDQLTHEIERIAQRRELQRQLTEARSELKSRVGDPEIVGRAPVMSRLFELMAAIAHSDAPVLIAGESGTGKELVARRLHQTGPRARSPFVAVNCAAFPDTLIEAELFGHERGAFTGAVRRRDGRFKTANGGTLLLDEIADLPLPAQAKLLRVLQEGIVESIGSDTPVRVDVRIISATNCDLRKRVEEGSFREDLFYRLRVLELAVAPLRERAGDLPLLVEHFLRKFAPHGQTNGLTHQAWSALSFWDFPGNVRELEHAIHHAVVLAGDGEIDLQHLPNELASAYRSRTDAADALATGSVVSLAEATRQFQRDHILRALDTTGGNRGKAAKLLGISRKNLWEKLRSLHDRASASEDPPTSDTGNGQ